MGGGSWTSADWVKYSSSSITGKSTAAIYTSSTASTDYDSRHISMRESRDNTEHPESNAIILALDVTGSMGSLLKTMAEKLGILVGEIYDRNPVCDPQVMFAAIGDGMCDSYPMQATQFESDIRIAKQLTELYFERGGGGNGFESYPYAWYFAANKTSIDCYEKRGKKGFLFTMGDDCYPEVLHKEEIKKFFNDEVSEDINTKALLNQVSRQYEVFHLMMMEGGSASQIHPEKWSNLMGERAIKVTDCSKIPEIIVSILETMGGKPVADVIKSWDGSTAIAVSNAISGLSTTTAKDELVTF